MGRITHMHDVLTKQIAVRGDPSRCDYIIAARERERESSPAITIRHHRSDPFVHLALRQAHTTHTQSDYPFRPFVSFARCCCCRRRCCRCRCRPCVHSILIPIRVYGFACSRTLLHTYTHIAARLVQLDAHSYICAYACTFNPQFVYVLRNARPVSTVPRDNDEGDEEVDGQCALRGRKEKLRAWVPYRDVLSHEEVVV